MSVNPLTKRMISVSLFSLTLTGCFHPPYNNFRPDNRSLKYIATGTAVGAGIGTVVGGFTAAGAAIGAVTGTLITYEKNSRTTIIKELQKQDIQLIKYGDTMTLIIPTDRYYVFNSPHLNEICYAGLENVVRLLKFYKCNPIYVAAFTDNVGSRHHKKMLSQARAETMLTFLWANNIPARRLHAEGYGDKHDIGDNHLIRGSAYNRRIEIQWTTAPSHTGPQAAPYSDMMK